MKKLLVLGLLVAISISGCLSTPAREVSNVCNLLDEKVSWYRAAKLSEEKWKVPMHLQLAIIHQESRFASKAKPPRNKIFGFIPGTENTEDAMLALRVLYCLGCAAFFVPALFLTWFYPLTPEKHEELRLELEEKTQKELET